MEMTVKEGIKHIKDSNSEEGIDRKEDEIELHSQKQDDAKKEEQPYNNSDDDFNNQKECDDNTEGDSDVLTVHHSVQGNKETHCLTVEVGARLKVLIQTSDDWWYCKTTDGSTSEKGYVPPYCFQETLDWQDEEYFGSYAGQKIHHEMLTDRPRTLAYQLAIESLGDLVKDKIVLDVGCGSGVLSMFAAKAGARKVFAVDASDITETTSQIVADNGYENVIEVYQGRIEDVKLPEKVDVIVSEWMGTFLIFEFMIESVLHARDLFLQPDGIILPNKAKLFLAPACAQELYTDWVDFWEDQYGFNMSAMLEDVKDTLLARPKHDHVVTPNDLLTNGPLSIFELDINTAIVDDLESFESAFEFEICKDGVMHGFASWFDVFFPTTVLSTSPSSPLTHWKQDIFMFDAPINVREGMILIGKCSMTRNREYRRHLHATITFDVLHHNDTDDVISSHSKMFPVWR